MEWTLFKWAIFAVSLFIGVPLSVWAMHVRPWMVRVMIFIFFFLIVHDLSINLISFEWYRGSSRGMEVILADLIAWALLIHVLTHSPKQFRRKWFSAEGWTLLLYAVAGVVSLALAVVPIYAWFGLWKLLRGVAVYFVFSQLIDRRQRIRDLLAIFVVMILYQVPFVLYQKYVLGIFRAIGTLPHMNTLAMLVNLLMAPVFALLLVGPSKIRSWHVAAIGSAAFIVVATGSRGALVSMGVAMAICFLFIRFHHVTTRRIILMTLMCLGAVGGGIKASDTVMERFMNAPKSSQEARDSFNLSARRMGHDFPFGVGLNNFSHMAGHTEYGDTAFNLARDVRDDGVAHHIYWLTIAELGYPGFLIFLVMILTVQARSLGLALWARDPLVRTLAVGCFAGLASLHFQGLLEWVLRQSNVWFLFCALAGSLTAIGRLEEALRHSATE